MTEEAIDRQKTGEATIDEYGERAIVRAMDEADLNEASETAEVVGTFLVDCSEVNSPVEATRTRITKLIEASAATIGDTVASVDGVTAAIDGGQWAVIVLALPNREVAVDAIPVVPGERVATGPGNERYEAFVRTYGTAEALWTMDGDIVPVEYASDESRWRLALDTREGDDRQPETTVTSIGLVGLCCSAAVLVGATVAARGPGALTDPVTGALLWVVIGTAVAAVSSHAIDRLRGPVDAGAGQ
ncbi:hypothetical protein BRD17_09785 [Halobacteriales archaeon SW_7_68_16]|nr:MAG: hypothetical protein BRD17_09785 [Halobacteriales archaeon SW_7_68_16]